MTPPAGRLRGVPANEARPARALLELSEGYAGTRWSASLTHCLFSPHARPIGIQALAAGGGPATCTESDNAAGRWTFCYLNTVLIAAAPRGRDPTIGDLAVSQCRRGHFAR